MSAEGYFQGQRSDRRVRCRDCRKLLAELVTRPWTIQCPRCKVVNRDDHQLELVHSE